MAETHTKPGRPVTEGQKKHTRLVTTAEQAVTRPVTPLHRDNGDEVHHFTIGYRPRGGYRCNPTPQLTINGRWMEKFGFDTGKLAIITVERGRMVIELDINI